MKPQEHIRQTIKKALDKLGYEISDPRLLNLERPKQEEFGDISSPVAMSLAQVAGKNPRQIAADIVRALEVDPFYVQKVDIAGPGFINFFLSQQCLQQMVVEIVQDGELYGRSDFGENQKVQLEFVSANPTGPLNVVSARAAAIGDVLANIFKAAGYDAYKEFYINDAGRQVRLLGESLGAQYMTALGFEREIPQDGYHGDYLRELAANIATREGSAYVKLSEDERAEVMSQIALSHIVEQQQKSLSAYGVFFDNWFRESSLRDKGAEQSILEKLQEKNLTYQQDGALWFKSSEFGDEKDRVLITQEGEPTYFFIDIAYHQTKYERGFTAVHDFWGPDHHGYIDRMKSAMLALGHPKDSFHVSIIQQVNLLRDGKPVKMSKRAGEIIEMDELIEEVGVDAARYFFVDRKMSQPLDFDIELAKKQSDENPVYYLQYAHARICSIFRFAEESGIGEPESFATNVLDSYHELNVIKRLIDYPEVVVKSAQFLEPHRLTAYLTEVATVFHRFYHEHRVVTEDREKTFARLLLAKATRQVLSNGLKLLGITAPEKM